MNTSQLTPKQIGAGAPYHVQGVFFKGMQYVVKDREDRTVYLTRSNRGANQRCKLLAEAAKRS